MNIGSNKFDKKYSKKASERERERKSLKRATINAPKYKEQGRERRRESTFKQNGCLCVAKQTTKLIPAFTICRLDIIRHYEREPELTTRIKECESERKRNLSLSLPRSRYLTFDLMKVCRPSTSPMISSLSRSLNLERVPVSHIGNDQSSSSFSLPLSLPQFEMINARASIFSSKMFSHFFSLFFLVLFLHKQVRKKHDTKHTETRLRIKVFLPT